ncbi:MAG: hypothetical protein CVU34_01655 [Betaproteobacteria bacterium HGW-Betaproteobacteria-7]|jgi:uncharacterized membrane protein|nr:MAG: hypothetical protein CVU34_01655 [Betaproteobacteria bacterium HGW-Betaproteobacteria-7]
MRHSFDFDVAGFDLPAVRSVSADRPLAWLKAGWRDLKANPLPSLAYGLLFALGGDLIILAVLDHPHLLTVAISGFFLLAPLLAAGLYELSRANGAGQRLLFIDSLRCFRRNGQSLALFGLLLALMAIIWERFSAIAFALIGGDMVGSAVLSDIILGGEHLGFIAIWFASGAIMAMVVFALAVVSVPMMLDRDADVATAILSSLRAVAHNPWPLLLWAAIIVALTLIGFATLLFGLVVLMPILGHASWHAYRDLVE